MQFNWKKYIRECFDSTPICTLATVDKKGVWACPVRFAFDNKYDIYFITSPKSRHMKNVSRNNNVSLTIYSTENRTHGPVCGAYIEGKVISIREKELARAHNVYFARFGPTKSKPSDFSGKSEWRLYAVEHQTMWYFDNRFFGEKRQKVPLGKL